MRAELLLVGRSVLGWQVALLRDLGAERIICLCDNAAGEVLRLQHEVEASGAAFHALKGFAALPALVRAEDELIILADGVLPDVALVRAVAGTNPSPETQAKVEALHKGVACLPVDHPLTGAFPDDFERIDAARCWAGVLVMRGAPVQQLSDFPADADAVSVLLRLALQSGTPCRDLGTSVLAPQSLLLADSAQAVAAHQTAMLAAVTSPPDWRAPTQALAAVLVRRLAARGYGLGHGPAITTGAALAVMLAGAAAAAWGAPAIGLAVTAIGTFAAQLSGGFTDLAQRLHLGAAADHRACSAKRARRRAGAGGGGVGLGGSADIAGAIGGSRRPARSMRGDRGVAACRFAAAHRPRLN
ncbi:MAG: hypothetical protein NWP98_08735 [Erythrobacter sp.]|nr:hypothetical protein [Erythrobacter sp.]